MKKTAILVALILLLACSKKLQLAEENLGEQTQQAIPVNKATVATAATAEKNSALNPICPILQSRKWDAKLYKFANKSGFYNLTLTGEIDLPSAGYSINWSPGIADRMMPPGQRVNISAVPPKAMTAQVITTTSVKFAMKTRISRFRFLSIYCGKKLLVSIPDVSPLN